MTYQEVFQLAQYKGYDSILVFPARYGGDAMLPHEVTNEAAELCELTLIQKWLREEKQISVVVEDHYSTMDWVVRVRPTWALPSENGRLCNSYEDALMHGINEALKILP